MVKAINVTLPEELILQADEWGKKHFQNRSEVIKNALVQYITSNVQTVIDGSKISPGEQEEVIQESKPATELPPFCTANSFCRSRSTGHFRIVTNDGADEKVLYLCPTHLGLAKREGEVKEL